MSNKSATVGLKVLALLLMIGGVLGVGVALYMAQRILRVHWIYGVLVAGFLWLFVWLALTGYRLWRGEAGGGKLTDFATRYAAAWSSQNPDSLAACYGEAGSLRVNAAEPAVGRAAIAAKARDFMTAFPDMVVKLDAVHGDGSQATFRWVWTGTNTGPGGAGKAVHITGHEEWTFGADGLIAKSQGHFDEADYQRQLQPDAQVPS